MFTEHVFIPFLLDKTSKINLRLAGTMELKGEGWRCGLKSVMIDKKWSLINDEITIVYTNGYKSVLKPKKTHSVYELKKVLEEMFGKSRIKRSTFDEILNDDDDGSDEEKKSVTPPPVIEPFDTSKLDSRNNTERTKNVTPPPGLIPFNIPPKKPEITDDKMQVVSFPSDEPGKIGEEKYYIVYKSLKDALLYSPELPPKDNLFCESGYDSIEFKYHEEINRYELIFDNQYVRAIHLSSGFSKVLGFKEMVFNKDVAQNAPMIENFHSHVVIHLNDIICPIHCGLYRETILDVLPLSHDRGFNFVNYNFPNFMKMSLNKFDTIDIEFKDLKGNPIYGANASGHIFLEFTKF